MASDDAEFAAAIAMSLADENAHAAPAHAREAKPPADSSAHAPAAAHAAPVQDFAIKHIRWGSQFCPILLQASHHPPPMRHA
jgi:hypothetical protein